MSWQLTLKPVPPECSEVAQASACGARERFHQARSYRRSPTGARVPPRRRIEAAVRSLDNIVETGPELSLVEQGRDASQSTIEFLGDAREQGCPHRCRRAGASTDIGFDAAHANRESAGDVGLRRDIG